MSIGVIGDLRQAADQLGCRAWIVGGYVRDRLLDRPNHDIDVVVEGGRALDLAARFAELTGASQPVTFPRFGTAHVSCHGFEVEFADARAESYGDDSRKPKVRPATIAEDVLRRDFTINALLMTFDGVIIDLVCGQRDLEAGTLRTPDDPRRTFADDPLRMFRAARFAAQLGLGLHSDILPAMREMAPRSRPPKLSMERIAEELRKLMVAPWPSAGLEILRDGDLLAEIAPELVAMVGVEQNEHHRWDVWEHTLRVVEGTEPNLILRLAALFHDIGKPRTADGQGHFYEHQTVGAEMTREIMTRLKFSNDETGQVVKLVRLHMHPMRYLPSWGDGAVRRLAREAGDLLPRLMQLARADAGGSAHPDREDHDDLEQRLVLINQQPPRFVLSVTGCDVMEVFGISPGPKVGEILGRLTELALDAEVAPDRETLLGILEGWSQEEGMEGHARPSQNQGTSKGVFDA